MKAPDGGPAFGHSAENGYCCGMSLRDWFAGIALSGMLTRVEFGDVNQYAHIDALSHAAYIFADAMLTQRLDAMKSATKHK